jgi:hypothetical protein
MATVSTGFANSLLNGSRFADIMLNSCIELRSGPPPLTADDVAGGTLLGRITRDGLPWVAGSPAGGLQWTISGRYLQAVPGHTWRITGLATGVLGHFRLVSNAVDSGDLSLTAPRIDGSIAVIDTVPADLYVPALEITPATSRQVDLFWITLF